VLSKVLELVMFPVIVKFAQENKCQLVLARAQNQYPDISLISEVDDAHYALDIKTTYRTGVDQQGRMKVNGMTLGTFGGYFRDRERSTISTFPYSRYKKHYVLGVLYSQVHGIDEQHVYEISDLGQIPSVATDFEFFLHEKYRIAADRTGSGNTKNIGSTVFLNRLVEGTGVFAELGIDIFDDYWRNYRTRAMAKAEGFETTPYSNLLEYKRYKEQGSGILQIPENQIKTEALEDQNPDMSQEE
jgi:Restriction endonuclease EcoRV